MREETIGVVSDEVDKTKATTSTERPFRILTPEEEAMRRKELKEVEKHGIQYGYVNSSN